MLLKAITPILLLMVCVSIPAGAYIDHRGHNVDSLETVMASWTARDLETAGEAELRHVSADIFNLMWGFKNANSAKSEYYARMLLEISGRMGWGDWECDAAKTVGEHFWAKENYDSAAYYYGIALKAAEAITVSTDGAGTDGRRTFSAEDRDDALSSMYGSLGNLYSMMDSTDLAIEYYEKAGIIFKEHGWHNSCSDLYYNMGETLRYEGDYKKAEEYYLEGLEHAVITGDSLEIATAYKGLGSLYLDTGNTSKALEYLSDANAYFADHEKEELQFRMESLDYTGQALALLNRRLTGIIVLLAILLVMAVAMAIVSRKLKRTEKENKELAEVLEDTVDKIGQTSNEDGIMLKPKEKEILSLIAKGYTNADIASAMNLSPETIKWYKKKLFAILDASNSAELVRIATERGLI